MKPTLTLIITLLSLSGFAQQIARVTAVQEGKQIVVTYDITGANPGDKLDVKLLYTQNNTNWREAVLGLTGDVGTGITPGAGKTIRWSPLTEVNKLTGSDYIFKVRAKYYPTKSNDDVKGLTESKPDCDEMSKQAKAYYIDKNYNTAIQLYEDARTKCNTLKTLDVYYLGRACLILDDSIKADAAFAEFISRAPATPDGYYWRARTNLKFGKAEDFYSFPYYEKYIELASTNPAKYKDNLVESYQYLGIYYLEKMKDKAKAKEYLEKALELDPNNQDTMDFLKQLK